MTMNTFDNIFILVIFAGILYLIGDLIYLIIKKGE